MGAQPHRSRGVLFASITAALVVLLLTGATSGPPEPEATEAPSDQVGGGQGQPVHETLPTLELPAVKPNPWLPRSLVRQRIERDGYLCSQVNVGSAGVNIWGDAANEPTIAVDPTRPSRMAIAWRQFDSTLSDYRTLAVSYSVDGGRTWTRAESPDPGAFRTDPVLAAGADGTFYLYSLGEGIDHCELFTSTDGGRTWSAPRTAFGGDKPWIAVDTIESTRNGPPGSSRTHVYAAWSDGLSCCESRVFTRSIDGGASFSEPISMDPLPTWGSLAIGPEHELYLVGVIDLFTIGVAAWPGAGDPTAEPSFEVATIPLDGFYMYTLDPNPEGLIGQLWIAADTSEGPRRGSLYVLTPAVPFLDDPLDLHLIRSTDKGQTWSTPIKIPEQDTGQWQWFGTLSIAPDGRLDVVWVESLEAEQASLGELHWSSSNDGGDTWTSPEAITPPFDSHIGWPVQRRLGDYYHMVSDSTGVDLAFAATFNGEQDIYYLRLGPRDCNRNGIADEIDIAVGAQGGLILDCDADQALDTCELLSGAMHDADGNGVPDACDPMPAPRRPSARAEAAEQDTQQNRVDGPA